MMWEEVATAAKVITGKEIDIEITHLPPLEGVSTLTCVTQEGRRELVLTGKGVEERVEKNGIDLKIFSLKPLNFLEVLQVWIKHLSTCNSRSVTLVCPAYREKWLT